MISCANTRLKGKTKNSEVVGVLTKDFAQKQGLDQVELCVWGIWEGVADRGVMVQLEEWEPE